MRIRRENQTWSSWLVSFTIFFIGTLLILWAVQLAFDL